LPDDVDILSSFLDTLALGNLEPLPGTPNVWWTGTLIEGTAPALTGKFTSLLPSKRDSQPLSSDREWMQAHWSVFAT
jgi:hypothetical protein